MPRMVVVFILESSWGQRREMCFLNNLARVEPFLEHQIVHLRNINSIVGNKNFFPSKHAAQ